MATAVALLCLACLAAAWALARRWQGSWIGPGGLACCVWLFGAGVPLLVAGSYPVHASAYLLVTAFVAVSVAGSSIGIRLRGTPTRATLPTLALDRLYYASLAVGSVAPLLLYRIAAARFGGADIVDIAGDVTAARYSGDFDQPAVVSILVMLLYLSALAGGIQFSSGTGRRRWQYLLWLAPLLGVGVIMTTKATVLFGGCLFAGALTCGLAMRGKASKVALGRLVLRTSAVCVVAFGYVVASQLVRWGSGDSAATVAAIERSAGTFAAHMSVLGAWLDEGGAAHSEMTMGGYTVAGVAEAVGARPREMGLYEDSVTFANGYTSNIYTALRSLIEDFGLAGALLVMFGLSLGAGRCWALIQDGNLAAIGPYAAFAGYLLASPITSIFVYNSNVGALVLFVFTMALLGRPVRLRLKEPAHA